MRNFDNEDRALQSLTEGELREGILKTCRHCGITNQDLALLECGGVPNQRLIRSTFDWLSKPNAVGFPAMLDAMPMRLEGRKGRPQLGYLLTEFGGQVLRLLEPNIKVRMNKPKDAKDLNHRFALLDVFARVLQNRWQAEIEKVIPYAGGEIRCDLLVHRPNDSDLYIEIEQELTRNNAARAVEKFRNWQAYALSANTVPNMVFVFNLTDAKLAPTLAIWQEALRPVSEYDFSLDVRYILVGMLEGQMFDTALRSFGVRMEPSDPPAPDAASEVLSQSAAPEVWLPEAYELLPQFEYLVEHYYDTEASRDFFELIHYIHQASYSRDSDTFAESRLPFKSLWLLRHYLNLPQNQNMYEDLKQALIWVQSRGNMGLIMMRNVICNILWDTFLKRHELAMGGNLRVSLEVPDYVNRNSTFEVKADFWNDRDITRIKEYCDALSWALTAFLWYPEVLGTGTQPWRKKSKKMKGKKQNDTDTD